MFCCLHMRAVGCCIAAVLAGGLAACSTHPLPEDVSRSSTVDIVKSIRCEARAGLDSVVAALRPDERPKALPIIQATMIGYYFDFDIDETNGAGGASPADPLVQLTRPDKFTNLSLTASANAARSNKRTFTIIEPLTDLAKDANREICQDRVKGANWTYPVAGKIGLDEVVRTYLKLELLTELQVSNKAPGGFPTHVVFSDELVFLTKFDAGASAEIVLDAVVGRLRVTNASVGVGASREDRHSVTVALTRSTVDVDEDLPVRTAAPKARSRSAALTEGAREERDRLIQDGSVRDPRSQSRLIQMNAKARDSIAIELHRRRAPKDEHSEAARALGQRFLDILKVP